MPDARGTGITQNDLGTHVPGGDCGRGFGGLPQSTESEGRPFPGPKPMGYFCVIIPHSLDT